MNRKTFDDYVARFNAKDASAFDDFLLPSVKVQNGRMVYFGVDGMKEHYQKIWKSMDETLNVLDFVSDETRAGVVMHTHFAVREDCPDSPFGPVEVGVTFDYTGVIFYAIEDGKFASILVSYLDFVKTDRDGTKTSLGIVH